MNLDKNKEICLNICFFNIIFVIQKYYGDAKKEMSDSKFGSPFNNI